MRSASATRMTRVSQVWVPRNQKPTRVSGTKSASIPAIFAQNYTASTR